MSRKIFTAIWGAALAVFAASLVFIMGVSYNYFTGVQMKQLHAETALAAQGVSLCGKDYFTGLSTGDYRVTWIDADGTVLFDTGADASRMENHLEREEIRQALRNGTGEARRYSPTLADRQLYAAQRLPDGTVLRLSVVQLALWSLVLGFAQPICLVALLALALSFLLASRLTKKIVAPINAIDPDNPMQYYEKDEYREVEPLLRRIAAQQAQLRRDRAEIERAVLETYRALGMRDCGCIDLIWDGAQAIILEAVANPCFSAEAPFAQAAKAAGLTLPNLLNELVESALDA